MQQIFDPSAPMQHPYAQNIELSMRPSTTLRHKGSYPPGMPSNAGPSYSHPHYLNQPALPDFRFGGAPIPMEMWQGQDWEDDSGLETDGIFNSSEVKQRRRTTPDQLRVLEHWFDINPKPDNSMREHLAVELGMSKRNVQVWFQNRRAKLKGRANKEKQDAALAAPAPSSTPLLPAMDHVGMGRRVSLAGGEAAGIETWAAKRAAKQSLQALRVPNGFVSPPMRSPYFVQASAARRGSIPYQEIPPVNNLSPKISPGLRPMPSALHLTAIRNNSRRSSMPSAQLISSGPFTPPRLNVATQPLRELSPIKDQCEDSRFFYSESDYSSNYISPPTSTYQASPAESLYPFTPNAPLPNPGFSFGSAHLDQPQSEDDARVQAIYAAMRQGRVGSLASINTATTDATETGSDLSQDWSSLLPPGFDPDLRRASAPADLLHDMGVLGLNTAPPLRPSPLGNHYSEPVSATSSYSPQTYLHPFSSQPSPAGTQSVSSSEGPSPTSTHGNSHAPVYPQHFMSTSAGGINRSSSHHSIPEQHVFPPTFSDHSSPFSILPLQSGSHYLPPAPSLDGFYHHQDQVYDIQQYDHAVPSGIMSQGDLKDDYAVQPSEVPNGTHDAVYVSM